MHRVSVWLFPDPAVHMFCNQFTIKTHSSQKASHTAQALHIADDKRVAFVKCDFNVTNSERVCTTDMPRTSCPNSDRGLKITH